MYRYFCVVTGGGDPRCTVPRRPSSDSPASRAAARWPCAHPVTRAPQEHFPRFHSNVQAPRCFHLYSCTTPLCTAHVGLGFTPGRCRWPHQGCRLLSHTRTRARRCGMLPICGSISPSHAPHDTRRRPPSSSSALGRALGVVALHPAPSSPCVAAVVSPRVTALRYGVPVPLPLPLLRRLLLLHCFVL